MRWKALGDGACCPHCGHYTQMECDEYGATREMCYTCATPIGGPPRMPRPSPVQPPAAPAPEPAPLPVIARVIAPVIPRVVAPTPRPKQPWKYRPQGTARPCAAGVTCLGDGLLAQRRGRPRASGLCDACAAMAA